MCRKRRQSSEDSVSASLPVELPPLEGAHGPQKGSPKTRKRGWLWTLGIAGAVLLTLILLFLAGAKGVYDGLKDRALANHRTAQTHYAQGVEQLEAGNYELAVAEFEVAQRYDSNLPGLGERLQEAKQLALAQVTPTSSTRRDAAALLYRQAVPYYEGGNLVQAIALLEELRSLDADYQRENVETMLATAHYQLGLSAVQEDRLDDAAANLKAVLAVKPDEQKARDQLNLLDLYRAALNHWEQDWSATIQALKGLYALAPDYKDVRARLHNAHNFRAQAYANEGNWCRAAEDYGAAVEIFPLEVTVDRRDDAALRCQATAEAPTPAPTSPATPRPTPRPTAWVTPGPSATAAPAPTAAPAAVGQGKIAFGSYDAVKGRYDLYLADLSQARATLLRENASDPAFAAGGQRLVFQNRDPFHLGLAILDLRTNDIIELTPFSEDSAPAWSPSGGEIVFASDRHGDRRWRIYAISAGAVRGEGEQWAFGQLPTWSPDGSMIAYHGCDERGDNCAVWVMRPQGAAPKRLTGDPSDTSPSWSPDGSKVAFLSARSGNWELYLADVASGQEVRLTDHRATDVAPAWSRDGKRLAFLSNRDGAWAIYLLELASGQIQKAVATGDAYPDPVSERLAWMP